jgi:HEAT repeat protein
MMRIPTTLMLIAFLALAGTVSAEDAEITRLTQDLASSDKATCLQAADALGDLGSRAKAAVPALLEALKSEDPEVRWHVCRALGTIGGDSEAAANALAQLLKDEEPSVRAYAAFALGRMGEAAMPVVDAVLEASFDPEPLVRRAAGRAARSIDPPPEKTLPIILKILEEGDPAIIMPALSTLAEEGKEVVPRLRNALKHEKACYWACIVLAEIGADAAEAVPELQAVLEHPDPDVHMQALLALGEIGPASAPAVPKIIELLEQRGFPPVQSAAAYALRKIEAEGEADDEALKKQMMGSQDKFLQMVSAWSYASLNPDDKDAVRQALQLILAALQSDDPHLKSGAARALAELRVEGSDEAAAALVEVLDESDPYVIGNAIDALTALGPKALEGIGAALMRPGVQKYAIRLVYRMGPEAEQAVPELIEVLKQTPRNEDDLEFRKEVQIALGAIGPAAAPALPQLLQSLDSEDQEVRGSACYALAKIGPQAEGAVRRLVGLARQGNIRDRRASIFALLKIRPGEQRLKDLAIPMMIQALQSDRELVRYEAAMTLGDLGKDAESAIEPLKKLLNDEVPAVRMAAEEALKKIGS